MNENLFRFWENGHKGYFQIFSLKTFLFILALNLITHSSSNGDRIISPSSDDELVKTALRKAHVKILHLVPKESREFIYARIDLNDDGKKEILVAQRGSYFCGSGGCSALLLSSNGLVMNRFTLVDYPFIISSKTTYGWKDILIKSAGKYRRMKWSNGSYPTNPSIAPKTAISAKEIANTLLNWDDFNTKSNTF